MDVQEGQKLRRQSWHVRNNLCYRCDKNQRVPGKSCCLECERSKIKTYNNKSYYKRRDIIRTLINDLKNVPCADCGEMYHPCVMDFDHVRGTKKFNIAEAGEVRVATQRLIDLVLEEAGKCEIVCSNCHRMRTHNRREYSSS